MVQTSICFFNPRKDDFRVYVVPVSSGQNLLEKILLKEEENIGKVNHADYFQSYSEVSIEEPYFFVKKNISVRLSEFVKLLILDGTELPSIRDFVRQRNSKDKYPFTGFAVIKKNANGEFLIGIDALSDKFKLYRKNFLGIRLDHSYEVTDASSTILIPDYASILIKGKWSASKVEISEVFFRVRSASLFESMFDYRSLWTSEADELLEKQKELSIDSIGWSEFNKDIRNTRKFVRCLNSAEMKKGLTNVKAYFEVSELEGKLGFKLTTSGNSIKVSMQTSDEVKKFIDAFQKRIFQDPLEKGFIRTDTPEKM
ncbi:hypothetical protein HUU53_04740 [Candidatus Micrarchaeota archaeon]|nr:hypothetical protein [Candidatus Micrarchaeota archaeon]